MVRAGEASGALDVVLLRLGGLHRELRARLRGKVRTALTYPGAHGPCGHRHPLLSAVLRRAEGDPDLRGEPGGVAVDDDDPARRQRVSPGILVGRRDVDRQRGAGRAGERFGRRRAACASTAPCSALPYVGQVAQEGRAGALRAHAVDAAGERHRPAAVARHRQERGQQHGPRQGHRRRPLQHPRRTEHRATAEEERPVPASAACT